MAHAGVVPPPRLVAILLVGRLLLLRLGLAPSLLGPRLLRLGTAPHGGQYLLPAALALVLLGDMKTGGLLRRSGALAIVVGVHAALEIVKTLAVPVPRLPAHRRAVQLREVGGLVRSEQGTASATLEFSPHSTCLP